MMNLVSTSNIAYSYRQFRPDSLYKVFNGKITLFEDPKNPGHFPLFANTTTKEPLPPKNNYIVCFNEDIDEWEYIENHVGQKGFLNDNEYIIKDLGPLPEGFSTTISEAKYYQIRLNNVKMLIQTLLTKTDYLILPDYPLSEDEKNKIIELRSIIRNLDKNENYPFIHQVIPIPEWPLVNKKCPYSDLLNFITNVD